MKFSGSIPEAPLSIGDLVGQAVRVLRHNIPPIFRVMIVPSIWLMVGSFAIQWSFTYGFDPFKTGNWHHGITAFLVLTAGFVIAVLSGWVITLRQLALVRLLLGFSVDWHAADQFAWRRKWLLFGLYMIYGGLACVLVIGCLVETAGVGIFLRFFEGNKAATVAVTILGLFVVAMSFALVAGLYFMVCGLGFSILVCEEVPIFTVFGRSVQMTLNGFWRCMLFGLVIFAVVTALYSPLALPVAALSVADLLQHGVTSGDTYKMPLYLMAINQSWEALSGLIIRPVMFFAFGYYYLDWRIRNEGLDILRRLKVLAQPQA